MSRIGKQPVELPKGVTFSVAGGQIKVKGPKGELSKKIAPGITFSQEANVIKVIRDNDSRQQRAYHGLMRALLANMVTGVSAGFKRELEIIGIGYKAEVKGAKLIMNLGYSHPIVYPFPDGIKIDVDKATRVIVTGADKEKVGQVAAELRGKRPPDSYKGKGVRYAGERVRLKAGKSGQ
ncbi:MAG: 50S ribosomal protein L6 [Myxococcota bacterium]